MSIPSCFLFLFFFGHKRIQVKSINCGLCLRLLVFLMLSGDPRPPSFVVNYAYLDHVIYIYIRKEKDCRKKIRKTQAILFISTLITINTAFSFFNRFHQ